LIHCGLLFTRIAIAVLLCDTLVVQLPKEQRLVNWQLHVQILLGNILFEFISGCSLLIFQ
jgi:hypothetical protein